MRSKGQGRNCQERLRSSEWIGSDLYGGSLRGLEPTAAQQHRSSNSLKEVNARIYIVFFFLIYIPCAIEIKGKATLNNHPNSLQQPIDDVVLLLFSLRPIYTSDCLRGVGEKSPLFSPGLPIFRVCRLIPPPLSGFFLSLVLLPFGLLPTLYIYIFPPKMCTSSMTPRNCTIYVEHDGRSRRRIQCQKKKNKESNKKTQQTTNIVDYT